MDAVESAHSKRGILSRTSGLHDRAVQQSVVTAHRDHGARDPGLSARLGPNRERRLVDLVDAAVALAKRHDPVARDVDALRQRLAGRHHIVVLRGLSDGVELVLADSLARLASVLAHESGLRGVLEPCRDLAVVVVKPQHELTSVERSARERLPVRPVQDRAAHLSVVHMEVEREAHITRRDTQRGVPCAAHDVGRPSGSGRHGNARNGGKQCQDQSSSKSSENAFGHFLSHQNQQCRRVYQEPRGTIHRTVLLCTASTKAV